MVLADHYGLASGAASTCLQAAGNRARSIGGFGLGGVSGGFEWRKKSLKPESQVAGAATLTLRRFRLALAFDGCPAGIRCGHGSDIVAVHRPHLGEPAAVALGFAAQRLLDRGINEDTLTSGSSAAARIKTRWVGVQAFGSMSSRSARTIMTADISSRSCAKARGSALASAKYRRRARPDGWRAR